MAPRKAAERAAGHRKSAQPGDRDNRANSSLPRARSLLLAPTMSVSQLSLTVMALLALSSFVTLGEAANTAVRGDADASVLSATPPTVVPELGRAAHAAMGGLPRNLSALFRLRGQLEAVGIEGAALRGNALGDPTWREHFVYLPPGYDGKKRFPVVYLLPAYQSASRALLHSDAGQPNVFQIFDRAITRGFSDEAIVVGVDSNTSFGGSQYIDSLTTGAYQTSLVDDVMATIDANYRTLPGARAVAGHSSGGYGALRLALDRPGTVQAVASHAADAGFDTSLRPLFEGAAVRIREAGGLTRFARTVRAEGPASGGLASFLLAAATAYSPDLSLPFPFARMPFDLNTAELRPSVWARWLDHDPAVLTKRGGADAFRDLKLLYVDAGTRDEFDLNVGARSIAEDARAAGARVFHEEFDGGHGGTTHRFGISLPMLVDAISSQ